MADLPPAAIAIEAELTRLLDGGQADGGIIAAQDVLHMLHLLVHGAWRRVTLDAGGAIEELGLSPDFVAAARDGAAGVAARLGGLLEAAGHVPATDVPISPRTRQLAVALERGAVPLLDPATGELGWSRHSLHRDAYLLRTRLGPCVAMSISEPTRCEGETVWFLPHRRLLLTVGNSLQPDFTQRLAIDVLARCLLRAEALAAHLAAPPGDVALTEFPCPHIGHNLWNLASGWANLLAATPAGPMPARTLRLAGQDFFGAPAALFPERLGAVRDETVPDDDGLMDAMLAGRLLLLTPHDRWITADLARRVGEAAHAASAPAWLGELHRFRQDHFPLVIVGLRLENRCWVEQAEDWPALFREVRRHWPRAGFLLHGLSRDARLGWTTEWMSLEDELALAQAVRDGAGPEVPILNAVGTRLCEAIQAVMAGDAFVAPAGSGMALYKWLANKPGVTFSNAHVLDPANPHAGPLRVFELFREGVLASTWLRPEEVRDAEAERRGYAERANHHMDWRVLARALAPVLAALPPPGPTAAAGSP